MEDEAVDTQAGALEMPKLRIFRGRAPRVHVGTTGEIGESAQKIINSVTPPSSRRSESMIDVNQAINED